MRFAFIALLSAVAALAQPTAFTPRPLNPPNVSPDFHGWNIAPAVKRAPITNAERFAQGLPPLKSKARRHRGGPHHDPGYGSRATRVRSAPRAETSPTPPITTTCKVRVTDTDGIPQSYVSPVWNSFGEYGATQSTPDGALQMMFKYPVASPSQMNMVATNAPDASYPNVGGVMGFSSDSSDFGPGEFSYAYLAGTETIPSGPARSANSSYKQASGFDDGAESAIWAYNPATQEITPQWVNTDNSMPTTYIASVDDVFILTGDPGVASALGDAKIIKFKCEPVVASV